MHAHMDRTPRRAHRFDPHSHPLPLPPARSLAALDRRDEDRRAREAARSNLEAFLFATRDALFEDEEAVEAVSTEEQRDEVRALLEAVEDWLYDEGESAGLKAYEAKRAEVVSLAAPLQLRLRERTARPAAVKAATQVAVKAKQTAAEWRKERPWLTAEQVGDLEARAQELAAWLRDQLEAQEATAAHEPPAFTSADVAREAEKVRSLVKRLRKIPKPAPPKAEENVTVADAKLVNATEAEGGASTGAEGEAGEAAEAGEAGGAEASAGGDSEEPAAGGESDSEAGADAGDDEGASADESAHAAATDEEAGDEDGEEEKEEEEGDGRKDEL